MSLLMTMDYAGFTSCISDVELSKVLMIKHIFPSCLPRIRNPDVLAHFTERECRFCTCAEGALCLSNRSFTWLFRNDGTFTTWK
jgi:hypothetical protein